MHSSEVTFNQLIGITSSPLRNILGAVLQVDEAYNDLLEIKAGRSATVWGRSLFALADTDVAALSVDSTTKVISCKTGYNLFGAFKLGRSVITTGFSNAGNNGTFEITARVNDAITLADATGLVTETGDGTQQAVTAATQSEIDKVQDVIDGMIAAREIIDAARNVAVTTKERRDLLRRIS